MHIFSVDSPTMKFSLSNWIGCNVIIFYHLCSVFVHIEELGSVRILFVVSIVTYQPSAFYSISVINGMRQDAWQCYCTGSKPGLAGFGEYKNVVCFSQVFSCYLYLLQLPLPQINKCLSTQFFFILWVLLLVYCSVCKNFKETIDVT